MSSFHGSAFGQAAMTATLKGLTEGCERGEIRRFAMRVFLKDGSWEDVAAGDTEEERVEMLAKMHKMIEEGYYVPPVMRDWSRLPNPDPESLAGPPEPDSNDPL